MLDSEGRFLVWLLVVMSEPFDWDVIEVGAETVDLEVEVGGSRGVGETRVMR